MNPLRYSEDIRTVIILLFGIILFVLLWNLDTFNIPLYLCYLVFSISVCAINHNHSHVPLWKYTPLNVLTDYLIIFFQGHPIFMFNPAHKENHHVYCNTPKDYNYTWQKKDDNCLTGFLTHPFFAANNLIKLIPGYLFHLYETDKKEFYYACSQYIVFIGYNVTVLQLDIWKSVIFVFTPQAVSLFYLLVSNYLQHAHTDETCPYNNSRNFTGTMNLFLFNTGYHTAHHLWPHIHWSQLPEAHGKIEHLILPELKQKSLLNYMYRTYLLALINSDYASRTLRNENS